MDVILVSFLLFGLTLGGSAQTAARGGAITGVVQDQTGAVLPNARVTLLASNSSTPLAATTTDGAGRFRLEAVAPGPYDVRIEFQGFRVSVAHARVTTRPTAALTIVMQIEGLSQTVSVSSGTGNATADAVSNANAISVDANTLDNLPVLDQDVVSAMSRFLDSSAIGTNGTSILVDGVEVNALALSASAIQQIKINQDPYSAEFMRPGHGRIEIITKPGGQAQDDRRRECHCRPRQSPAVRYRERRAVGERGCVV